MSDIHIGALLSPKAREGIDIFLDRIGREDLKGNLWWDLNEFCGLWFRLKLAQDTPEIFPAGKSATLQYMDGLICGTITKETL